MSRAREGWLHLLVVLALVLLVTFAAVGRSWLPLVFPTTGVLFAAGAAACAVALDRAERARTFLLRALLRVLLPFWAFAAVAVPVMADRGWRADPDLGADPLTWATGWRWVLPLTDPPVSVAGLDWMPWLWLVRTFLWLVLLTPALLWLFRRWPLRVAAVPVVVLLVVTVGLTDLFGRSYDAVVTVCVYYCCWLLGFAYADGTLLRLPPVRTVAAGAVLIAAGAWWALTAQRGLDAEDLYDVPWATLLFSVGGLLVLLRAQPAFAWVAGGRRWGAVLAFLPRRMLTVVLWADVAVLLAPTVLAETPLAGQNTPDVGGDLLRYAAAWVLLLGAAILLGWLEAWPAGRRGFLRRRRPAGRRYVLTDNVAAEDARAG